MAARVENESRFSCNWYGDHATDETIAATKTAVIEKAAVRAAPKYRYERYATDTAMPLQLPLMITIPKAEAITTRRYGPFLRKAYASGIEDAAKNASELGLPSVQNARPVSHGSTAEAENGSYQRTWRTAYGKLTPRKPNTNAAIEAF